jgi:hypothetical protein
MAATTTQAATYEDTPLNPYSGLDFTTGDWTPASCSNLGTYPFTRNGVTHSVAVGCPNKTTNPLFANEIDGVHTYSYNGGSATRSFLFYTGLGQTNVEIDIPNRVYYKAESAVAWVSQYRAEFILSEVLDVTNDGRLIHHLTITNRTTETLEGLTFRVNLDTMLDGNDNITIFSVGGNHDAAYMKNAAIRLDLALINGDHMLAGSARGTSCQIAREMGSVPHVWNAREV